jgi:electron transfer flavoprotein-quinone oxidoreductase
MGDRFLRCFQDFKMHPAICPLLEGGKTVEYGRHLVAEEGYRRIPKRLYREGFLVCGEAAGFFVNLGYTIRGIDLAVLSGLAAVDGSVPDRLRKQIWSVVRGNKLTCGNCLQTASGG